MHDLLSLGLVLCRFFRRRWKTPLVRLVLVHQLGPLPGEAPAHSDQLTHAEEGNEEARIVALVDRELAHVEVNVDESGGEDWTQGVAQASGDPHDDGHHVAPVLLPDGLAEIGENRIR